VNPLRSAKENGQKVASHRPKNGSLQLSCAGRRSDPAPLGVTRSMEEETRPANVSMGLCNPAR